MVVSLSPTPLVERRGAELVVVPDDSTIKAGMVLRAGRSSRLAREPGTIGTAKRGFLVALARLCQRTFRDDSDTALARWRTTSWCCPATSQLPSEWTRVIWGLSDNHTIRICTTVGGSCAGPSVPHFFYSCVLLASYHVFLEWVVARTPQQLRNIGTRDGKHVVQVLPIPLLPIRHRGLEMVLVTYC